ncbi:hypothetical protein [Acholeplasma granularum]|uniref:hypothetical protein n=1 Tax=Acholeplasma granularum TaxID=264635 RepID=UPI0004705E31|nr:hypothetical protein [Acholeplasma granularum]
MKKKELIELIKTKSLEVEIKDLGANIISNIKNIPEKESYTLPRKSIRPKLMLSAVVGFSLILVLLMFLLVPQNEIDSEPQFENIDNALMFSSISSTSLLENIDLYDMSQNLSSIKKTNELNSLPIINDRLDNMNKYLTMIEKLYVSDTNFNKEKQFKDNQKNNQKIKFKSIDFLNEETVYELNYQNIYTNGNNTLNLEGTIKVDDNEYLFNGRSEKNEKNTLNMQINKNNQNYIKLTHMTTKDNTKFNYEIFVNDILTEKIDFIIKDISREKEVTIVLEKDLSVTTYTFTKSQESKSPILKVKYAINENTLEESGSLIIRITNQFGENGYAILVKPDNGKPFMINQNRNNHKRQNNKI